MPPAVASQFSVPAEFVVSKLVTDDSFRIAVTDNQIHPQRLYYTIT
jgi:hypothetical protein